MVTSGSGVTMVTSGSGVTMVTSNSGVTMVTSNGGVTMVTIHITIPPYQLYIRTVSLINVFQTVWIWFTLYIKYRASSIVQ